MIQNFYAIEWFIYAAVIMMTLLFSGVSIAPTILCGLWGSTVLTFVLKMWRIRNSVHKSDKIVQDRVTGMLHKLDALRDDDFK